MSGEFKNPRIGVNLTGFGNVRMRSFSNLELSLERPEPGSAAAAVTSQKTAVNSVFFREFLKEQ